MCRPEKKFFRIGSGNALVFSKIFLLCVIAAHISCEEEENSKQLENAEPVQTTKPHIIFVLADDLGWNDVSFHGSPEILTPNIDALASSSIILNNYYTETACTPSRAALLTGKYPIHIGLQHFGIRNDEPTALPPEIKILPEYLKNLDYVSHIVGKWHLGYSKKEYTPINRGFDSFFGFYNEKIDYFDYTSLETSKDSNFQVLYGVDLQNGIEPVKTFRGQYATEVFTEKAIEIIKEHNETKPLFLFLSHLACHTGNEYMPLQAPLSLTNKYAKITDKNRRIYAGIVTSLDESVGQIVEALSKRNFLQNSVIVFTSDNGGSTTGAASNWPLRGRQPASWEGALRVPSFIWSPLLKLKDPRTSKQLMHVSDWLPTLYNVAGGNIKELENIDGFNMWDSLISNTPSPRIEILHNIHLIYSSAALRRGDYKLLRGSPPGDNNLWYGSAANIDMDSALSNDDYLNSSRIKPILETLGFWLPKEPGFWRNNSIVQCEQPPPQTTADCIPAEFPCLFNVAADPCEYNNLANKYPRIVRSMLAILKEYNDTMVEPLVNATDIRADPRCHGFSYVPWLDIEYSADCPYF